MGYSLIKQKVFIMTLFMRQRIIDMTYDMQHNLCVMLAIDNGIISYNPYWF